MYKWSPFALLWLGMLVAVVLLMWLPLIVSLPAAIVGAGILIKAVHDDLPKDHANLAGRMFYANVSIVIAVILVIMILQFIFK